MRMTLTVPSGTYEVTDSRFPLIRLLFAVMWHRTEHLLHGDGWID
jgi:hypothetical protein